GVLLARTAKILTLGKIDYIEKIQRMSEDRCFSHEDAEKDFGYKPCFFSEGILAEINEYISQKS
ncbi:MAG TPA: nucleoside-diphosphate sugar epimerase, partial [Ruminococcaceae bacterium]|nr:nucleoside-diphosphate sugar epimerase [Oscillospiraceae bacterium]